MKFPCNSGKCALGCSLHIIDLFNSKSYFLHTKSKYMNSIALPISSCNYFTGSNESGRFTYALLANITLKHNELLGHSDKSGWAGLKCFPEYILSSLELITCLIKFMALPWIFLCRNFTIVELERVQNSSIFCANVCLLAGNLSF